METVGMHNTDCDASRILSDICFKCHETWHKIYR